MPKATTPTSGHRRHNPLEADITNTGLLRQKAPKRQSRDENADDNAPVGPKQARAVFHLSKELADEERLENEALSGPASKPDPFAFNSRFPDPLPGETGEAVDYEDAHEAAWEEEDDVEEVEVEPQDLAAFRKFLPEEDEDDLLKYGWDRRPTGPPAEEGETRNLADIILQRIEEFERREAGGGMEMDRPIDEDELPEKIVEVYTKVGEILSRYKSGRLPKVFKILPQTPRWEEILEFTKPNDWSANAVYQATRIFASANRDVAEAYYELVLLERFRDDIHENKKLNVHIFNSMRKALYHPGSFFKGFLFPLVASGTCTLKEARVVASILSSHKIPVMYSAAAIQKLCEFAAQEASQNTELSGATNLFIKTLLEKKYALPYQVVDSLVFHFLRFRSVDPASMKPGDEMDEDEVKAGLHRRLPVIWHQGLLAFAERYRNDITEDQRESLLDLLQTHGHGAIAPDVRRELLAGRGRGVPIQQQGAALDGDDTMIIDG